MGFPLRRALMGARFFLKTDYDFWHPYLPPTLVNKIDGRGRYYLDFSQKTDHPGPFDNAGIPFTEYAGRIGRQHYSIDICQYALAHHEKWIQTRQESHLTAFIRQANWLTSELRPFSYGDERCGLWFNTFDWRGLRAPWPSAMAQGQGISVLTRAFNVTGDSRFLETAEIAFRAFRIPLESGGVTRFDAAGNPFFEEWPTRRPSKILNGFVFALWGVLDFAAVTGDADAKALYSSALSSLERHLPLYDIRFWSRYDLEKRILPNVSSAFYQLLHVNQMIALYNLTDNTTFDYYAKRWKGQYDRRLNKSIALALKLLNQISTRIETHDE